MKRVLYCFLSLVRVIPFNPLLALVPLYIFRHSTRARSRTTVLHIRALRWKKYSKHRITLCWKWFLTVSFSVSMFSQLKCLLIFLFLWRNNQNLQNQSNKNISFRHFKGNIFPFKSFMCEWWFWRNSRSSFFTCIYLSLLLIQTLFYIMWNTFEFSFNYFHLPNVFFFLSMIQPFGTTILKRFIKIYLFKDDVLIVKLYNFFYSRKRRKTDCFN